MLHVDELVVIRHEHLARLAAADVRLHVLPHVQQLRDCRLKLGRLAVETLLENSSHTSLPRRASERERERSRDQEGGQERERVCVCVSLSVCHETHSKVTWRCFLEAECNHGQDVHLSIAGWQRPLADERRIRRAKNALPRRDLDLQVTSAARR